MILINSINRDITTDNVVKWLLKYKKPFLRLNDVVDIVDISYSNQAKVECLKLTFENGSSIHLNTVSAYWYRRGDYTIKLPHLLRNDEDPGLIYHEKYLLEEYSALFNYFLDFLKTKVFCIGDLKSCTHVNKISILNLAKKTGLNTPETIITGHKKEVISFFELHQQIITKPIHNPFLYDVDDFCYPTFTRLIQEDFLKEAPSIFQPTLFQQYIEKKFEIRAFYLKGTFYSMAIFSQNDQQTKVDFKMYNDEKPNRNVPFKLPSSLEEKLKLLMENLKFESGSIDLIYTLNNEFYFLEVNPIGQFGMVSYPCNYNLEREIALTLIKNN